MADGEIIRPRSLFQERYLNCDSNIIIAGGAMGSSKSFIGLLRHLRWVDDPYYRGFCFRRNSTTLMKEGGLFQEAVDLYRHYEPNIQVRLKDQKIVFPSGATVSFTSYENDQASEKIRGLQFTTAMYDEGTDSAEAHAWMIISRLRSKSKAPHSLWITCNPSPDHYLREWVDWWLFPEGHEKFGLPDPEKNGVERWLLRLNGQVFWGDTKEELIDRFGKPELPHDHKQQVKPLSVTVLLGTIYDNPTLIETNPHYLASLEALPDVEKRRNLYGDWEARAEGSTYFERGWVEEINHVDESQVMATIRAYDFAGTLRSDVSPNPDYTASVRMRKMKDGTYVIDDVRRARIRHGDWEKFVVSCWEDDPPNTEQVIPQDPGVAAAKATQLFCRRLAELGIITKKEKTNKSKLDRFRPFSSFALNGGVKILKGCVDDLENGVMSDNNTLYRELEAFTGERSRKEWGHDDMVDATSSAFTALASKTTSLSGLSKNLVDINDSLRVTNPFRG